MANLGFIPAWQFNMNPAVNPQVVSMQFPPGMSQSTVQPVGPYMNSPCQGLGCAGLGQLGIEPIDTVNAVFDSWWWKNRKWVAFGAVAALGLGVLGGITAILK
ncbi:MAG: hypothetical protein ACREJC_04480 [Tepidisphaeraceae bacterium]